MSFLSLLVLACGVGAVASVKVVGDIKQYDDINGDGGHGRAFKHFDNDDDEVVSRNELARYNVSNHHIDYYNRDGNPGLTYSEFVVFWRERKMYRVANFDGPDPVGHNLPLGAHKASLGSIDVIEGQMDPKIFWDKYVKGHRPALFKGVDADSRAAKHWSEDYVEKHFGWVDLKIEPKLESRGDESILSKMPHRMNIHEFVKRARNENIYAVSVMPQAMAWDVNIPAAMQCGSRRKQFDSHMKTLRDHHFPHPDGKNWMTHIYEANLWLSLGRTRSQLHYDREHNVNCAYVGRKKWIMIDTRKHYDDITWQRGGRYNSEDDLLSAGTDWVPVDPDRVDHRIHANFSKIDYYEFIQEPGDCVFIPYSMLHYVNKTNPGFHTAASWMFLPNEVFDEEACKEAPKENIPMAVHDILWYYSGQGVIPQGYPAPDMEVMHRIREIMRDMAEDHMTVEVLEEWLRQGESPLNHEPEELQQFHRNFARFAKDPEKGLTVAEMGWPNVPLALWLQFSARGDPEGMLPCDDGMYYIPRPQNETIQTNEFLDAMEHKNKAQRQDL